MKRWLLLIAIVMSILLPPTLHAEESKEEKKEVTVAVGLYSWHFKSNSANNFNRLLAFSYDGWCIGWFNNSHYDETVFAGYAFRTDKHSISKKSDDWFVRGGLYFGIVYGYGDDLPTNVGGFSPYALPVAEVGYKKVSFELGIIPLPNEAGLVTGIIKYSF